MSPTALNNSNGHHDSFTLPPNAERKVHPSAARAPADLIKVESDSTEYTPEGIKSKFTDRGAEVVKDKDGKYTVKKTENTFEFFTKTKVGRVGLMLVGIGGNNGTTVVATNLANKHGISWHTKDGEQQPNYIGSLVRASTVQLGVDPETGKSIYVPISDMLPMVHPNDFVITGWDISSMPLDQAMARGKVLEYDLQRQLAPYMKDMKPLPSIYYPDFIAANQEDRADNVIEGTKASWAHVEHIQKDIR